jgi:UDP-2-acetamido-3-amino-2,3-dideoxy-glucuronate N-acetyltransferase
MPMPNLPSNVSVADDVRLGRDVRLAPFVNLYGCEIGDDTRLGAFVEVQRGARIGRRCKVSSHSFICSGVLLEDEVFIGHGVVFINDRYPRATNPDGAVRNEADWRLEPTVVRRGASIGSGAVIMCGVEIGERAIVGAGALVIHDVSPCALVAGNPASLRRIISDVESDGEKRAAKEFRNGDQTG